MIQRIRSKLVMKYSITEAETYLRNGRRLAEQRLQPNGRKKNSADHPLKENRKTVSITS